jgi:hypothetical protein
MLQYVKEKGGDNMDKKETLLAFRVNGETREKIKTGAAEYGFDTSTFLRIAALHTLKEMRNEESRHTILQSYTKEISFSI